MLTGGRVFNADANLFEGLSRGPCLTGIRRGRPSTRVSAQLPWHGAYRATRSGLPSVGRMKPDRGGHDLRCGRMGQR